MDGTFSQVRRTFVDEQITTRWYNKLPMEITVVINNKDGVKENIIQMNCRSRLIYYSTDGQTDRLDEH